MRYLRKLERLKMPAGWHFQSWAMKLWVVSSNCCAPWLKRLIICKQKRSRCRWSFLRLLELRSVSLRNESRRYWSFVSVEYIFLTLEGIREQDLGDNYDCYEFQRALLSCLEERFSSRALDNETRPLQIGRLKRITRQEIFKEVKLILATLLDPRLKTAPFLGE